MSICNVGGGYLITSKSMNVLIAGRNMEYESLPRIDAVIVNSAEPATTDNLHILLDANKDLTVYASTAGIRNITEILNRDFKYRVCKNKEKLLLGDYELTFHLTPGSPNPDSMMTCVEGEGISEVFTAADVKTDIETDNAFNDRLIVAYASDFGYTKRMAEEIKNAAGERALIFDLEKECEATVLAVRKGGCLALGTYTRDRNMPSSVWRFISSLDVARVSGEPYFVFGSYGWSGEGLNIADKLLGELRMRRYDKPFEVVFKPTDEDLSKLKAMTREFMDNNGRK